MIGRLGLSLDKLTVLTEAATGDYALTASIAALGGAERVLLLTRDSAFGSADAAVRATLRVARDWGVDQRLHILNSREDPAMQNADIVTNLGFVRPIDRAMIRFLKRGAVIPLMFEAWEYRSEDVDLSACEEVGIPVAGTDETDARIGILEYLGPVGLRLLFEAGVEVLRASILVIGGGPFAGPVVRALASAGAEVRQWDPSEASTVSVDLVTGLDAVIVVEHRVRDLLLGPNGPLPPDRLVDASPGVVVAHIAGVIDAETLRDHGVGVHPLAPAAAGYMSVRTDYVGPRPLIDLHAAGLRVGQALVGAVRSGREGVDAAVAAVADCALVQPLTTRG